MDLQTKDGNAFILELNEKGEILGSLQSTNSALHGISQITVGEKYTYFASPENTKIWYMDTYDLLNTSWVSLKNLIKVSLPMLIIMWFSYTRKPWLL